MARLLTVCTAICIQGTVGFVSGCTAGQADRSLAVAPQSGAQERQLNGGAARSRNGGSGSSQMRQPPQANAGAASATENSQQINNSYISGVANQYIQHFASDHESARELGRLQESLSRLDTDLAASADCEQSPLYREKLEQDLSSLQARALQFRADTIDPFQQWMAGIIVAGTMCGLGDSASAVTYAAFDDYLKWQARLRDYPGLDAPVLIIVATVCRENSLFEDALHAYSLLAQFAFPDTLTSLVVAVDFAFCASETGHDADAFQILTEAIAHAERKAILSDQRLTRLLAAAHLNAGTACLQLGDPDRAEQHVESALKYRPTFAKAVNNQGVLHLSRGDAAAAVECFTQAVSLDPLLPEPSENLVRTALESGNTVALQAEVRRLDGLPGLTAERMYNAGTACLHIEEFPLAVKFLRASCDRHPTSLAYANLGFALVGVGDAEGARRAFEESLRLEPLRVEAFRGLADLLEQTKALQEAIAIYDTGLRHFPDDAGLHGGLADLLFVMNRHAQAREHFTEYQKSYPSHFGASAKGAICEWAIGSQHSALASLKLAVIAAVERGRDLDDMWSKVCVWSDTAGCPDLAIWAADENIRSEPDSPWPYVTKASVHERHGSLAAACDSYAKAIEVQRRHLETMNSAEGDRDLAKILNDSAVTLWAFGERDQARVQLTEAIQLIQAARPFLPEEAVGPYAEIIERNIADRQLMSP